MGEALKRLGIALLMVLLMTRPGSAGSLTSDRPIYQYLDRNGTWVFTDDLSHVPAEYRSSAKLVELPPALKIPEPAPPPKPKTFSLWTPTGINGWPAEYKLVLGGILPMAILVLWALHFFRKRSESLATKILLRLGMMGLVIITLYLCYFLFLRAQAGRLIGAMPGVSDLPSVTQQQVETLQKQQEDRLKAIEDIADQK